MTHFLHSIPGSLLEAVSKLEIVRQNKARVDRAGLGVPLVYMLILEQRRAACNAGLAYKINFAMASNNIAERIPRL